MTDFRVRMEVIKSLGRVCIFLSLEVILIKMRVRQSAFKKSLIINGMEKQSAYSGNRVQVESVTLFHLACGARRAQTQRS